MTDFKAIPDDMVRHVWVSKYGETVVSPSYYEENGTPQDADGNDMVYSHTEIEGFPDMAGKLGVIAASFREHEMYHTPKSKEEATSWCEVQGKANHMSVIGFMVGLNYAAEMIKQIIEGTHPGLTSTYDPDASVPIPAQDNRPNSKG